MTTVDSPVTLPSTTTTGEIPDYDQWGNVLIKVDVGAATFHCRFVEHVGKQKPRKVTFLADAPCVLRFSNIDVFGKIKATLAKGPNDLPVLGKDGTETIYQIDGTEIVNSPPKIVVP